MYKWFTADNERFWDIALIMGKLMDKNMEKEMRTLRLHGNSDSSDRSNELTI